MDCLSKPKKALSVLFVLAILGSSLPASADPYSVEVIVFENLVSDSSEGELWTRGSVGIDVSSAVEPDIKYEAESPLSTVADLLDTDPNYRVLYHNRWIQELETKSKSEIIHIHDAAIDAWTESAHASRYLDGVVRFYRGRFLQFEAHLAYRPLGMDDHITDIDEPNRMTLPIQRYTLNQKRRIKSNQLHYFDHPKFGLLVMVAAEEANPELETSGPE